MAYIELDIDELIDSAVGCGTFPASLCTTPASTAELDEIDIILGGTCSVNPFASGSSAGSWSSDQPSPSAGHAAVRSTSSAAMRLLHARLPCSGSLRATRRSASVACHVVAIATQGGALVPRRHTGVPSERARSKPRSSGRRVHLPGGGAVSA
eukprot:CAMPEP_0183407958 /NCGR_PEP_ID=MMETSP0370-20130417/17730_1 /TAXON_ID=268820 /ORGANISM="Peridinium aciculiferum, Strain PAER-2" /LENGTH=152 /DNA_ID=CAMNT_0025590383 /DNA_START=30 /DNA_END=488 /DNA_ORIENTATION=+